MTIKSTLTVPPSPAKRLLFATVGVLLCLSALAQSYVVETSTNMLTWSTVTATNQAAGFRVFRVHGIGQGWTAAFGTICYGATVTFSNNLLSVIGSLATTNDSARWAASSKTNFPMGLKIQ